MDHQPDDIDRLLAAALDPHADARTRAIHLLWSLDDELREALFELYEEILAGQPTDLPFPAPWAVPFDTVLELDDHAIQTLLQEVNRDVLIMALQGASAQLLARFARNLSARAWQMTQEDMQCHAPGRSTDVRRARWEILRIALRLEAAQRD